MTNGRCRQHFAYVCVFLIIMGKVMINMETYLIENGLSAEPTVHCEPNAIAVNFAVRKPFEGRIFVKGFSDKPDCVKPGQGTMNLSIELALKDCGMQRLRNIGDGNATSRGLTVSTTLVISFHKIFVTKIDRIFRISCNYTIAVKTVTSSLDVSMLPTTEISVQNEMPICKYEILNSAIDGPPIRYATVGQRIFHKWSCEMKQKDQDPGYCMVVHSCSVADGQGAKSYRIIDENGCSTDKDILLGLSYMSDMVAGQEAQVFKYADTSTINFNCQVELKLKQGNCQIVQPKCLENSFKRRSAETNQENQTTNHYTWENNFGTLSSIFFDPLNQDVPSSELFVFDIDEPQANIWKASRRESLFTERQLTGELHDENQPITEDFDQNQKNQFCISRTSFLMFLVFMATALVFGGCSLACLGRKYMKTRRRFDIMF